MAFIRILSPKSAPPVFLFEGSTETIPTVFSGKSRKNLLTNSSTKLDLPAPPVPVIPRTGVLECSESFLTLAMDTACFSAKFSAAEIIRAMATEFLSLILSSESPISSPKGKSDFSTKSLIIPCKPNSRPSSGEYIRVMP